VCFNFLHPWKAPKAPVQSANFAKGDLELPEFLGKVAPGKGQSANPEVLEK
jgi:hypothetical protein